MRRSPLGHPAARRTFRQEIVDLHRAIFRRNQRRINASVAGYTGAFRRYEREYLRGVGRYEQPATLVELDAMLAQADVIYVGDYHTLAQAQRSFLRLLRRLPTDRPVIVALEFVQGRHQAALDRFMRGAMSEQLFLRAIDHTSPWMSNGWESFTEIFAMARQRGWPVLAIDSPGRGPAGASLAARDRYAARRMARALGHETRPRVIALVGELHVAPAHLPRAVGDELARLGGAARSLVVYQNCQEIYWQLEARGLEHEVELVRVAAGQYCLINTPPIVCQQSFLNALDLDDEIPSVEAPAENFKEYARLIASFFDLDLADALDDVEVATVADLSFLNALRERGDFSDADMRRIHKQILHSESYYIPRAKTAYLGNLSVNHAAEEAAHFVRHVVGGLGEPRLWVDAFYARCLEEALGFLGSKLINHKRKCATLASLERQATERGIPRRDRRVARAVLLHTRMEQGRRVRGARALYAADADTFNGVTHMLGYRLGERLYYGLVSGRLAKSEIRTLFLEKFVAEGAALTTYLYLIGRTAKVRVPERM
ncbi:MAG: ChaN family lipoprotein [Deltaproteobacteria bacterium]|nr:ChaN family lipoprotein [Deltaproteobacteria bacterium]